MLDEFDLASSNYMYEIKEGYISDELIDYFKKENFEIKNIDDYINLIKIKLISETVKDNYRNLEQELGYDGFNKFVILNDNGFIRNINCLLIKYVDKNLKNIFDTEDSVLKSRSLDLICENKISKENLEYIIDNLVSENQVLFLQKHKEFFSLIGKVDKKLKDSFIEKIFVPVYIFKIEIQLDIFNNYKNSKKDIKEIFEKEIRRTLECDEFKELDIFMRKTIIEKILNHKDISKDTKIFIEEGLKTLNTEFKKEIREKGVLFKEEVNFDDYLSDIKKVDNFREKLFFIDYHFYEVGIFSYYEVMPNIEKDSIEKLLFNSSNNINYSRKFSQSMEKNKIKKFLIINYLIVKYEDLFWNELKFLYKDVLLIMSKSENNLFVDELKKLYSIELFKDCSVKIVGEIELLLRQIYFVEKYESSISGSEYVHVGLNDILSDKSLCNIFSEKELKCLRYILIEKEGFNYRNSLAHNNDNSLEQTKIITLFLLSVFIFILITVDHNKKS